jgi:hypothetical protein
MATTAAGLKKSRFLRGSDTPRCAVVWPVVIRIPAKAPQQRAARARVQAYTEVKPSSSDNALEHVACRRPSQRLPIVFLPIAIFAARPRSCAPRNSSGKRQQSGVLRARKHNATSFGVASADTYVGRSSAIPERQALTSLSPAARRSLARTALAHSRKSPD